MTRIIQIGPDRFKVEDRKPRLGETYMGLDGSWKIAEKNFDYMILPVLLSKSPTDDNEIDVYLNSNGFTKIEEWAIDQGYKFNDDVDEWRDDENKPVDIEEVLRETMTDEMHKYLDSLP